MEETNFSSTDKILAKIIQEIPKPVINSTHNVFHDIMSCVIEQQIHYRSTKKIFQKMLNASHLEELTPDNFQKFEEKAFGSIKLATKKYETILGVLEFWNNNTIDWQSLPDKDVLE